MESKGLNALLSELEQSVERTKRLPAMQRIGQINDLVSLQLSLLHELVSQVDILRERIVSIEDAIVEVLRNEFYKGVSTQEKNHD